MIKKKNKLNNEIEENLEDVTIEEIDAEMEDIFIDREKIDNIKYSFDKDTLIKEILDKADKDISKNKLRKKITKIAASIVVILSIGIYSPALAYSVDPVMKVLENINDLLKIDEFASYLGIDTIIPKAVIDENGDLKFVTVTKYKVEKTEIYIENQPHEINKSNDENKENDNDKSDNNEVSQYYSEYGLIDFIHKMSNKIINPVDGKKYGTTDITPDNIEIAINSLKNINDEQAKDYLYTELNRWKKGDFENAVLVHNYVWHMLDGDIGRASSLDYKEINKITKKYFK